jgi:hypothetical protein
MAATSCVGLLITATPKKILLAVLSPHSTHTLQPLDVVVFSPLSKYHSQELNRYLHQSQELISVKKGDFYSNVLVSVE